MRLVTIAAVAVIQTESLSKRYGSQRGIEDITMTVEPGEVFGLLGPNGAGKTTLIRTLLDLLHPTAGSARLFGLDSQRDSVAIRTRLGSFGFTGDKADTKVANLSGGERARLMLAIATLDKPNLYNSHAC